MLNSKSSDRHQGIFFFFVSYQLLTPLPMKTFFNKLWQYNDWANLSLIDSMAQQEEVLPHKSLQLLSHIMNAQLIWIERIKGVISKHGVWDEHDLATCRKLHLLSSEQIQAEIE